MRLVYMSTILVALAAVGCAREGANRPADPGVQTDTERGRNIMERDRGFVERGREGIERERASGNRDTLDMREDRTARRPGEERPLDREGDGVLR